MLVYLAGQVGIVTEERDGEFKIDKKFMNKVDTFLNRLLGLNLPAQRHLFDYFSSTHEAVVKEAKAAGACMHEACVKPVVHIATTHRTHLTPVAIVY